jgi:hypothetical protein
MAWPPAVREPNCYLPIRTKIELRPLFFPDRSLPPRRSPPLRLATGCRLGISPHQFPPPKVKGRLLERFAPTELPHRNIRTTLPVNHPPPELSLAPIASAPVPGHRLILKLTTKGQCSGHHDRPDAVRGTGNSGRYFGSRTRRGLGTRLHFRFPPSNVKKAAIGTSGSRDCRASI